jgi:putative addiction module component (TIGR02574 family)
VISYVCMSTEELIKTALGLSREARVLLAEKLLESLDFREDFELSPAWREEIRRRCQELDSGAVKVIPAEDVFKRIAEKLG